MKNIPNKLPHVEYLRECFDLDAVAGVLIWKRRPVSHFKSVPGRTASTKCNAWNSRLAGKVVGHIEPQNGGREYRRLSLDGLHYRVHRVIFFMTTGEEPPEVDHKNRDGGNNSDANLRAATRVQNCHNGSIRKSNKSGLKGVLTRDDGFFAAQIGFKGKAIYLGLFRTAEAAHAAYVAASKRLHGDFACSG